MRPLTVLVALGQNWGIGNSGNLPWLRFPIDLAWFRQKTLGGTVIMGRRTWESIGKRALEGRRNIVISQTLPEGQIDQLTTVVKNFDSALQIRGESIFWRTFVIGGREVYLQALLRPDCKELLITYVGANFACDTFFPDLLPKKWQVITSEQRGKETVIDHAGISRTLPFERVTLRPRAACNTGQWIGPCYSEEDGYLKLCRNILKYGEKRADRTRVGTLSLFGATCRYRLRGDSRCFEWPLITTKKIPWKAVIVELLWFLRGETNVKTLQEQGVRIWDGNTSAEYLRRRGLYYADGEAGPIYGHQFRRFGASHHAVGAVISSTAGVDQIAYVVRELAQNQTSRKAVISLWNPVDLPAMALEPCHILYQFWIAGRGDVVPRLNCALTQRSGDMGLGVPFNVASAALLTAIIARLVEAATGQPLALGDLVHHIGDAHIYLNHRETIERQVTRYPRPLPVLHIADRGQNVVNDFILKDFDVVGYMPYDSLPMQMAV